MRITFNKLHSTNKIKNSWNSEQKKLAREVENEVGNEIGTTSQTIFSSSYISMNSMNNMNGYFTRTNISSLSPIEPYFRPDLTKFDKNYLLNITYGYWKFH
jgi:hypothetical protein